MRGKKGQARRQKTKGRRAKKRGWHRADQGGTATATRAEDEERLRLKRWLAHVPPPDSEIWPEECRGERWKRVYAILFAGKCQLCAYSFPPSRWRQGMDKCHGLPRLLLCTNRPDHPGEMIEVLPVETCRNFRPKRWRRTPARGVTNPSFDESDPTVRRIPLGDNLFATVDARDYKRLNKHKWYACGHGCTVYAVASVAGKMVLMHRLIMRARKGYVVHHIDGNGLNNRHCNLREVTAEQNRVSRRPRGGVSGFVGVYPVGKKWQASIVYRGHDYYLGLFDDPVTAAKARDRKAYALHGKHAYLNFPEDYPPPKSRRHRKSTKRAKPRKRPRNRK